MRAGSPCGAREPKALDAIGLFVSEDGYTSISVAVAMLVSLALLFSAATAGWAMSKAAATQEVADATALAGENSVAAFATIAQTLDACVLSMGLTGVFVLGAGLVLSAIPGASAAGAEVVSAGKSVLDARRKFASSAADGLSRLERTLPLLIATNSYACARANSEGETSYVGIAVPYPQEGQSEYATGDDVEADDMEESAEALQEAADREAEAKERADAALLAGWTADCGGSPYCMRERASSLAGLSGVSNPYYALEDWTFGAPLERARTYYAKRVAIEAPEGSSVDALTDSACRERFYTYALREVKKGSYIEHADGTVEIDLPRLPHNTSEMRSTTLYTDATWPCSSENEGATLHSYEGCPGAKGASCGTASLSQLESGAVRECHVCKMSAADLGKVAAASTSTSNGFEHYWRDVVDASEAYEAARDEMAKAEQDLRDIGEEGKSAFEEALDLLAVERPRLCPPGAWGCVAIVIRDAEALPSALTEAFLSSGELPRGAAVSGAVLAPDDATSGDGVLSHFFDGLGASGQGSGVLGGICELWGSLLRSYGSAYENASDAADSLFDGIDGIFGGSASAWLRDALKDIVHDAGLEPADMRLRKPVLVNTTTILEQAGADDVAAVRSLVESLPSDGTPAQMAEAVGEYVVDEYGDTEITLAELPIPGTELTIPLTIDLATLLGAA